MNTMLKRIVSMFLCFVLVAGYLPAGALAAETEETVVTAAAEATNAPSVVELSDEATVVVEEEAAEAEENEEESLTADTGDPEEAVSEEANTSEEAPAEEETSDEVTSEEETSEEEITEEETSEEATEEAAAFVLEAAPVDVSLLDADDSVVVIAGSDYQASNSGTTMQNIGAQIKADYANPFGILMGGDYDAGDVYPDASHLTAVDNTITSVFSSIADENRIMIQGNHETYGNLSPSSNTLLDDTGAYDMGSYSVYAINYEDFDSASSGLKTYLDGKTGYTKPIFVMSHQPLHKTTRGDNNAAVKLFNVLNAYDALNIIFLFGHNHSGGYDAYLGNGSIYLKKGDSITVAGGSTSELKFTYMNYGYVGYIGTSHGSADQTLTMTAFEIYEDEVIIKRYDADGQHVLKAAGNTTDSGYTADTNVYGQAVLSLSTGESTISEISADSGDDNTGTETPDTPTTPDTPDAPATGKIWRKATTITAGKNYMLVNYGSNASGVATYAVNSTAGATAVTVQTDSTGAYVVNNDMALAWTAETHGTSTYYTLKNTSNNQYLVMNRDSSTNVDGPVATSSAAGADGTYSVWTVDSDVLVCKNAKSSSTAHYQTRYTGTEFHSYNIEYASTDDNNWVVIFEETSETGTGSGGGSTVTPEGGDWVTIIAPGEGTPAVPDKTEYKYVLDTDGVDTNTKYLIVNTSNNGGAYVLTNNNGTAGRTSVTISNNEILVENDTAINWIFSGSTSGTVVNQGKYVYPNNGSLALQNSGTDMTIDDQHNGAYKIYRSGRENSTNYYYYLTYGSNKWTGGRVRRTSGTDNIANVYLFAHEEDIVTPGTPAIPGAAGLFAKITGNLEYNVERGLSAEQVIALVQAEIKGYEYEGTSAPGADVTGTEITEQLEFVLDANYSGAKAGEYSVAIKYKGVTLGTAKVIVPEVAITGYDCQTSGSVKVGATGKTRTGANITVNLEDGTSYTVPVTLDMLSGNFTTETAGAYTGLTVTYNDVKVSENFTLVVREPSSYPEYPDEGAVKVNKTGTGVQFQSTGVAQVEVSASGIPMNQGVDVLLVLDTSSSMSMKGSLTDGRTRIDVLKECVNALIANLQAERDDGSVPDVQMAVVHFNGYTGNKNTNYIGSTARSTSTLGGTLTDDGNGGAWVDVQNMGSNWASVIPDDCSGTNYDHGLLQAYDLLSARQEAESSRKQFVLFMSDGAPFQYNGVNSGSIDKNGDWAEWILGSHTQAEVEALSHVKNPEFYYGNNGGNGQKHRVAEAIKGTGDFEIVTYSDTSSSGTTKLETVPGLGITMYSVGLALEGTNMPTDVAGQEAILRTIASSDDVFYSVTSAAGLQEAFDDFAGEVLMAATNARFVDQMGDAYNLKMGQIKDLYGNAVEGVENKIEILSYAIWTRADYLANKCTLDQIGDRKLNTDGKPIATVLETVTFNADGTEAYSDKIDNKQTNILVDGVICAQNFWYNTNSNAVTIEGISIPTGVGSNDLTTGSSNVLPAETFYWKVGTIKTTELAMRYYVYLEGSMEGTRDAGSYPTNEYAILYYNNYLNQPTGQPCHKDTVSPVMAWESANVSYAFYLVDEDGNIIVNQTTGETGSFANKIAVTNPVVYEEVLLNNTDTVESIEVASTGVLPDGYQLYDNASVYTIRINSDATGSWNIAKGTEKATTYVTHFDLNNPTAYSSEMSKSADADFTHTIVWFAVVWKVQALPDSVVIDYGLPVDIAVLSNDMFGENGKLAGVGAYSDALKLEGYDPALASGFGEEYKAADSADDLLAYGDTKIDTATGKVRYTPNTTEMNGYDKFAYAVNYTGNENAGFYYDTVTVIPATTIYYEDDFLTYESFTWDNATNSWVPRTASLWSTAGNVNGNATQAEDRPGKYALEDANNIYGYDSANLNMTQYSLGSAAKATVDYDNYAQASFTFYGTGFDVISMTSNMTGLILVDVQKYENNQWTNFAKYTVDTYYGYKQISGDADKDGQIEEGELVWAVDPNANGSLYQVPVIKMANKPYGQYRVTIKATYEPSLDHVENSESYDFYLDAIRIYDPANDGAADGTTDDTIEKAYVADGEGWPSYIELRNNLIAAKDFNAIVDKNTVVTGAVFIDGDADVKNNQIADYIGYGPNNEVYLKSGQSVAFILDLPGNIANVHIGIKSADGNPCTYTVANYAQNANSEKDIEAGQKYHERTSTVDTTTDMYYDLTSWRNDIIVISNTGSSGILSLTNIKSTYKSDPAGNETQNVDEPGNNETQNVDEPDNNENGIAPASFEEELSGETQMYMTTGAAALTLRTMNAPAEEEIPEPSVPESSEPEKPTVPEETKPVKPDNSELKAAVEEAKKLKQKGHTRESFKKLQTAIKAAEKVLKDKKATQAQIDKALADLNAAVDGLETVAVNPIKPKPGGSNGKIKNNFKAMDSIADVLGNFLKGIKR